ncbi:MAG: GntR family transcriptional regulator [Actinomycetota bacterium]|nr:GntR family transcriptional regulator [Actinomycetota bacterium]
MTDVSVPLGLQLPSGASSLADGVVAAVRDGVARGLLVPDTTYSVYQLADELGVSRSPAREALLRLGEAGLVTIVRNRGFHVVRPTAHDVEEIFEVRLALEPAAARRLCERGDDEAVAGVGAAYDDLASAARRHDEPAFWRADRAVHDRILRGADNGRAAVIVEQLRAATVLLGDPTTATGRSLTEICAEHGPVVQAVLARDGDAAEAAMREHLSRTGALLAAAAG